MPQPAPVMLPEKPFKVWEIDQPGDVKKQQVGQGTDVPTAVAIMCAYWQTRQIVQGQSGYVVAVYDESLGAPGEAVAYIGAYGTGQYPVE